MRNPFRQFTISPGGENKSISPDDNRLTSSDALVLNCANSAGTACEIAQSMGDPRDERLRMARSADGDRRCISRGGRRDSHPKPRCPACGLVVERPHGSDSECIAALQDEVRRVTSASERARGHGRNPLIRCYPRWAGSPRWPRCGRETERWRRNLNDAQARH
jgi:hypothetical protein